jgi:L-aspartate oxidase
MSDFIGIVRTTSRLKMADDRVKVILKAINNYYLTKPASYAIVELRNIALVASLIIRSAIKRKESRGLHFVLDYPKTDERQKRNTIIKPSSYLAKRSKNG